MSILKFFVLSLITFTALNTYAENLKVDFCEFSTNSDRQIVRFDESNRRLLSAKNSEFVGSYSTLIALAENEDKKIEVIPTSQAEMEMTTKQILANSKGKDEAQTYKALAEIYRSVISLSVLSRHTTSDFSIPSPASVSIAVTTFEEVVLSLSRSKFPKMLAMEDYKPLDTKNNEISLQYKATYLANNGTAPETLLTIRCFVAPISAPTERIMRF